MPNRFPAMIAAAVAAAAWAGRTAMADPPVSAAVGGAPSAHASPTYRPSASVAPANASAQQVRAARANATVKLGETVRAWPLGRGLTVGQLVDRTRSTDALNRVLDAAAPLGGPAWVNAQTCQIKLSLPGRTVADAVAEMAGRYPGGRMPVSPGDLARNLDRLRATSFTATGSSVAGGNGIVDARPLQAAGPWSTLPDADRRRAVSAARDDAVNQFVENLARSVAGLPLGQPTGRPQPAGAAATAASAALAKPFVAAKVRAYLADQPVTDIVFRPDLTVSLAMTVDGRDLVETIHRAVTEDQPRLAGEAARAGQWGAVDRAVEGAVAMTVTGTATAGRTPPAAAPPTAGVANLSAVVFDLQPPDGFGGLLEAEATAAPPPAQPGRWASPFRARALAHDAAVDKLREQLMALRVSGELTLADAVKADPLLKGAISRVLLDAQDDRVESLADGSCRVRAHLNLRDAWDKLRGGS